MPTPTKFTENRKERILTVLRAGGSRREAAKAGEIDATTLGRWIEAGRTSRSPDGRWARFYRQVQEAEGGPPELQLLKDRFQIAMSNPESAWRFLERLEREESSPASEDRGPVSVTVTFGKFTPPTEGA